MRAMVYDGTRPRLAAVEMPRPTPGPGELLIRVEACGVCRTDLHVIDGEFTSPVLPLIPGHEIVGRIEALGPSVRGWRLGQRVGVPWLGHTCGSCAYCRAQQENFCDRPGFTGYTLNGGYAENCTADVGYVFALPEHRSAVSLAQLLCAGLIGYRALRLCGPVSALGLYGFGAAALILRQIACHQGIRVHAFTRDDDGAAQDFARWLGAAWVGGYSEAAPEPLDAAIIFAPVASRVLYGLADRGQLPAVLARVSARTQTPVPATLLVVAIILLLTQTLPIAVLAERTSQIVLFVFVRVNLSLLRLKRGGAGAHISRCRALFPCWAWPQAFCFSRRLSCDRMTIVRQTDKSKRRRET